jgi:hypothetical protein
VTGRPKQLDLEEELAVGEEGFDGWNVFSPRDDVDEDDGRKDESA